MLSELKLAKYRRLSEHALATRCSVAIASATGDRLLSDGEFDDTSRFVLHDREIAGAAEPTIKLIRGTGTATYALRTLQFVGQSDPYLLVLRMGGAVRRQHILPALMRDIAGAIAEDFATQEVVAGLAGELTVRYEELNLLYHFDDSVQESPECSIGQAITQVLDTCRDYLPVDMLGAVVPAEGLNLHAREPGFPPDVAENVLRRLRKSRFLDLKMRPETVVVNHDDQSVLSNTFRSLPYKSVVAPLIGVSNQVVGMFVLLNRLHRADFSNSDRRLAELVAAQLSKILQANRDRLTGLHNRKAFEWRLATMIDSARGTDAAHVLVYMDIDRFRFVNDVAGPAAGDELLAQGCAIFLQHARPNWFVARLGDDEFGLLIENTSLAAGRRIAEAIRRRVTEYKFLWGDRTFHTTGSFSVVPITRHTTAPAEVLAAADVACQLAKDTGRDAVRCYDPNDHNLARYHEQLKQASTIREALEENRFEIYGQAIAPLQAGGNHDHFEILVRLRDRDGTLVSPGVFIPAAEKYGLIIAIDRWVVEHALDTMQGLDHRAGAPAVSCSINLSGTSIGDKGFLNFIVTTIKKAALDPRRLTFEITETAAISNLSRALHFMSTVRALGCSFALDDFGVGTSSFGNLRTLPVDYVKIDGSFVRSIDSNKLNFAVVRSINEIGHLMGLKTVAEFVETGAVRDLLKATGIDYAQGFDIDKPSLLSEKYA